MAKQLYGLTDSDRRKIADLLRREMGRGGSSRPVPTRRRVRDGGGDSIRWGYATSAGSARSDSGGDWVAGAVTVQPMTPGGAGKTPSGAPIALVNWLPIAPAAGATVEYDAVTLEVREFTCPDEPEE